MLKKKISNSKNNVKMYENKCMNIKYFFTEIRFFLELISYKIFLGNEMTLFQYEMKLPDFLRTNCFRHDRFSDKWFLRFYRSI